MEEERSTVAGEVDQATTGTARASSAEGREGEDTSRNRFMRAYTGRWILVDVEQESDALEFRRWELAQPLVVERFSVRIRTPCEWTPAAWATSRRRDCASRLNRRG